MHSHHSHSGDYVSHAVDTLEGIVNQAYTMGFTHFCLTEHMPRLTLKYLYPEEIEKGYTDSNLKENFSKYIDHASRVQDQYNKEGKMKLLLGFEVEGLDDLHIAYTKNEIFSMTNFDMCVGSVHYINGIPIDFLRELWVDAVNSTDDKTARDLFRNYFDLQYKVLSVLQPQVIGHFDLVRLFQPDEEVDSTTGKLLKDVDLFEDWPEVGEKVIRNIKYATEYGALFELNSAAIRKGWDSPYPKPDIAKVITQHGGRFCLSDDSHSIQQVGLNYAKVWKFVCDVLQLDKIYHLDIDSGKTVVKGIDVETVSQSPFWNQYR